MKGNDTPAADQMWTHFRAARAARQRGDRATAWAELDAALAQDPARASAPLQLLQAELLNDAGDAVEAETVLKALVARHPDNLWGYRLLAQLARQRGDSEAAQAYLARARELDPHGRIAALPLLQAELLRDAGDTAGAEAVLKALVAAHPGNPWGHMLLARLAQDRADPAAQRHLQLALACDDADLNLQLAAAQLLLETGDSKAAVARLEQLRAAQGPQPQIMLPLIRAYRRFGASDLEEARMAEALAAHPRNAGLLRHMAGTYAGAIGPDELAIWLEQVRTQAGADLADELEFGALVQSCRFRTALLALRRRPQARRGAGQAHLVARALFGAHRRDLGARYLRLALRRWPGDPALLSLYVTQMLRSGRYAAAERQIELSAAASPKAVLPQRFMLAGFRGNFSEAACCYVQLRELGQATRNQRDTLAKMIYSALDPAEAPRVYAQIGAPGEDDDRPMHRAGLAGLMSMEFEMERAALAAAGGYDALADWVTARPHSAVPAIRLIDAWRAAAPASAPQPVAEAVIPRQVFQYWDKAEPPEAVQDMIASWARAPRFQHRQIDRPAALKFLRESLGVDWARAFELAQNPAQEADLLRLCLLAKSGGVWADADDVLCGDLGSVLDRGQGLILYREPLGGALGNNFMAAPPRHPVVIHAARLAQRALLQRQNENAWNKTGPGLLTRSVGQYLARTDPARARSQITILDWTELAGEISMHNQIAEKMTAAHWQADITRRRRSDLWSRLIAVSQRRQQ